MKDPLYGNKVAAVILATLLLFFGLPILVGTFYGGGGHGGADAHDGEHAEEGDNPAGLAYPIEYSLEGAAAVEEPEVDLGTLLADASPAAGERAMAVCAACHTFDEGGANSTGPNLWGVVGADVAAHPGFSYSGALQGLEGTWTYERLDAFLENSQGFVPGTQMAQRIGNEEKRADILAYLATLTSGEPLAFPEPAAPAPAKEMAGDATGEGDAHGEEGGEVEEAH